MKRKIHSYKRKGREREIEERYRKRRGTDREGEREGEPNQM